MIEVWSKASKASTATLEMIWPPWTSPRQTWWSNRAAGSNRRKSMAMRTSRTRIASCSRGTSTSKSTWHRLISQVTSSRKLRRWWWRQCKWRQLIRERIRSIGQTCLCLKSQMASIMSVSAEMMTFCEMFKRSLLLSSSIRCMMESPVRIMLLPQMGPSRTTPSS